MVFRDAQVAAVRLVQDGTHFAIAVRVALQQSHPVRQSFHPERQTPVLVIAERGGRAIGGGLHLQLAVVRIGVPGGELGANPPHHPPVIVVLERGGLPVGVGLRGHVPRLVVGVGLYPRARVVYPKLPPVAVVPEAGDRQQTNVFPFSMKNKISMNFYHFTANYIFILLFHNTNSQIRQIINLLRQQKQKKRQRVHLDVLQEHMHNYLINCRHILP